MKHNAIPVSYLDLDLCYRALGIPYDATPVQVEQAYAAYLETGRQKLLSPDPVLREQARNDMELITDLHLRIAGSLSYADRLQLATGTDYSDGGSPLVPYFLAFATGAVLAFGSWYLLI